LKKYDTNNININMSRTKEETDKMYGYLDKHKERYFDEIIF
jgi:hypothetical protein